MINEENYVVEYSLYQKQFHIQPLIYAINQNKMNVMNKIKNDYLIIGITDTFEEAEEFINEWKIVCKRHDAYSKSYCEN